jgi:hypothetical protein
VNPDRIGWQLGPGGQWLLLGNSGKTCHPRNIEFDEIREMSFQDDRLCEDLES